MMKNVKYQKLPQNESAVHKGGGRWLVLWRAINVLMTVFFILAAYVQKNDPDPYIWIPAYAVPTLLCLAVVIQPSYTESLWWRLTCWGHIALCLAGAAYLIITVVEMSTSPITNPLVFEEGRELFGLVITIAWLGIMSFSTPFSVNSQKQTGTFLLVMTGVLGLVPLALWGVCFIDSLGPHLSYCSEVCGTKHMP